MTFDAENELRVLVADDDPDSVEVFTRVMRLEGWRVASTSNGLDALETEAEFSPHVIFLDMEMPGLNGFEVATEIRRRWHAWPPRIFLVTGVLDLAPYQQEDSPFDAVFSKPVDVGMLLTQARSWRQR